MPVRCRVRLVRVVPMPAHIRRDDPPRTPVRGCTRTRTGHTGRVVPRPLVPMPAHIRRDDPPRTPVRGCTRTRTGHTGRVVPRPPQLALPGSTRTEPRRDPAQEVHSPY